MSQGLLGNQGKEPSLNGHGGYSNTYIDYLAEARKQLNIVDEFSDEQAYQMGMLNALIAIGYELRKINKHNKITQ